MVAVFAVLGLLLGAASAQALTITYEIGAGGSLGGGTITGAQIGCDATKGFSCGEPGVPLFSESTPDYAFSLDSLAGDPDPVITVGFGFTNTSNVVIPYTLNVTLPIAPPQNAPIQVAGSMGMTVTEGTPPGTATVSTVAGTPFFQGLIDNVAVPAGAIFPDPASFGCTTVTIAPCTDTINGTTGPTTLPGTDALNDIGITFRFELSPGDSVSGTGTWVVVQETVPEPGAGVLMLAGLVALVARQRR